MTIDGRPVDLGSWVGRGGVERQGATVGYAVGRGVLAQLRAPQRTDGLPIDVVASPSVAARAGRSGTLVVAVEGEPVAVRIARVAKLFPGVVGREDGRPDEATSFVVADQPTLSTALHAVAPGLGRPGERWLRLTAAEDADLAKHVPEGLRLASRRSIEARLAADPLAVGAAWTLGAAAGAALLLALAGLALAVAGDRHDEAGELADLASQGASPGTLRLHVALRAAIVWILGVVGGLAMGAALAALVTRFVGLTATATAPLPPLRGTVPWTAVGVGLLAVTLIGAVLVVAVTARASRGIGGRA